jgi:hypothetical protein
LEVGQSESQLLPVDQEALNRFMHLVQALIEVLDFVDRCRWRRRLIVFDKLIEIRRKPDRSRSCGSRR